MSFTKPKFRENVQYPADPAEPGSKTWVGFASSQRGSNHFMKNPQSHKTLWHGQSGAIHRSTIDHHVLPELTFRDKTPQGMEHVQPRQFHAQPRQPRYLIIAGT